LRLPEFSSSLPNEFSSSLPNEFSSSLPNEFCQVPLVDGEAIVTQSGNLPSFNPETWGELGQRI
jgi:hypothetical protein